MFALSGAIHPAIVAAQLRFQFFLRFRPARAYPPETGVRFQEACYSRAEAFKEDMA